MLLQPAAIIARKRDGLRLSAEEIAYFVEGFATGGIPDYQMAALAMAIYLRDMDAGETAALTDRMLHSGTILSWPDDAPPVVDKHSTGGIGDKVSLILAPLLACCGVWVPMISGRGLGPTGGTLDKLEAIPGFRTDLDVDEIRRVTARVGCVITGATAEIAPADKKLYALRDVTGTVASIPLITASIMSKKLAEGLDALVLDVKWGNGAFMKTAAQARALAESMVRTGQRMHVPTAALLTDMNQPLGRMAGNAVEVQESLDTLNGQGPPDLREVTLSLGSELLLLAGRTQDVAASRQRLQQALDSGAGRAKFDEMVAAQGGSPDARLVVAPASERVADRAGYVTRIDTEALGLAIIELGGGRRLQSDTIDHSVGLEMLVRLGDRVDQRQPLLRLFTPRPAAETVDALLQQAIQISEEPVPSPTLIVQRVSATGSSTPDT